MVLLAFTGLKITSTTTLGLVFPTVWDQTPHRFGFYYYFIRWKHYCHNDGTWLGFRQCRVSLLSLVFLCFRDGQRGMCLFVWSLCLSRRVPQVMSFLGCCLGWSLCSGILFLILRVDFAPLSFARSLDFWCLSWTPRVYFEHLVRILDSSNWRPDLWLHMSVLVAFISPK